MTDRDDDYSDAAMDRDQQECICTCHMMAAHTLACGCSPFGITAEDLHARLEKAYQDGDRDGRTAERWLIINWLDRLIANYTGRPGYFARIAAIHGIKDDLLQLKHREQSIPSNPELWR